MNGHLCVVCRDRETPVYRFACHQCYMRMPTVLRQKASWAWKHRMSEPRIFLDTVATVLSWHWDRRADEIDKKREGG